jgi:hypothetical protein
MLLAGAMSTCRQEGLAPWNIMKCEGTVVDSLYAASGSLMQPRRPSQHDGHDSCKLQGEFRIQPFRVYFRIVILFQKQFIIIEN